MHRASRPPTPCARHWRSPRHRRRDAPHRKGLMTDGNDRPRARDGNAARGAGEMAVSSLVPILPGISRFHGRKRMSYTLRDRVALVTGGGSGIGAGACMAFATAGAHVAVVDVRREAAETVAAAIRDAGGTAIALAADVTDEAAV